MRTRLDDLDETDEAIGISRHYHGYIAPVTLVLIMLRIIIVLLWDIKEALHDPETHQSGVVPYQQ